VLSKKWIKEKKNGHFLNESFLDSLHPPQDALGKKFWGEESQKDHLAR
jgi:hypothetical protein